MTNSSDSEDSQYQTDCPVLKKPRLRSSKASVTTQAKSSKSSTVAAEKDALRRQKALEKHFAKAQQQAAASKSPERAKDMGETSNPVSSELQQDVQEDQPNWSPTVPMGSHGFQAVPFQEGFIPDPPQPPSDSSQVPGRQHCVPSATFTPTAVVLRPLEVTQQSLSSDLRFAIVQTITQGIDEALAQRGILAPLHPEPSRSDPMHQHSHRHREYREGSRHASPSLHSEASLEGEEELGDFEMSGDEGLAQDKPSYSGLFHPHLFKTLLLKAKMTANMGQMDRSTSEAGESQDLCASLFTERVTTQEVIPSPKFFVDVIQRQWAQPLSIPAPSGMDKKMYTVEKELEDLLQIPSVDPPLANLASSAILPSDTAEGLKTEDRKADLAARKTH